MKGFTENETSINVKTDPVFSCTETLFSKYWQKHKYYVLWNFGSIRAKRIKTNFMFSSFLKTEEWTKVS